MLMSRVWTLLILIASGISLWTRTGKETTAALLEGASSGIQVTIAIAGPVCLWSGIGKLIDESKISTFLTKLLSPVLGRIFPSSKMDPELSWALSANTAANLLGLGNAATPLGIQAVKRLQDPMRPDYATDELCRLVVMNTASIQFLPTTVAAVRKTAGAVSPFDILPCVWITSLLSVSAGLGAAYMFRRLRRFA